MKRTKPTPPPEVRAEGRVLQVTLYDDDRDAIIAIMARLKRLGYTRTSQADAVRAAIRESAARIEDES